MLLSTFLARSAFSRTRDSAECVFVVSLQGSLGVLEIKAERIKRHMVLLPERQVL